MNSILRIHFIENNDKIHGLLFKNKFLCKTNFDEYSYFISHSFAHIIIKFNIIKEEKYFKSIMKKVFLCNNFTLNNFINTFDKFNDNFFNNFESMLYFLDLIIENLSALKDKESVINRKIFTTFNYLTNYEEILKQKNFEKFAIDIFYLLLNTKGKNNPQEIFEPVEIFLNKISNNKNLLLKIFYLFFSKLFEIPVEKEKNILNDINFDFFDKLKIIPLDYYKYNYLLNVIKTFSSFEPEIEIINLFYNYFQKIFLEYYNIFISQNNNIVNNTIQKKDEYFLLCNFFHIYNSKEIYYEYYLYLIKYSKKVNNNSGITKLIPELKDTIMIIYKICLNPFYFEIIIKLLKNPEEINQNIVYIKEILDIILQLDINDCNNISLIQKIMIFNTIQLLKIFYFISKDAKIFKTFLELNMQEYILIFFANLKDMKFIYLLHLIPININGEIYQKTILEICFNIAISFALLCKDGKIIEIFFDFFNENIINNENELEKSIVFILDISNKSLNKINDNYLNKFDKYYSKELQDYFAENNYKIEEKILLIKFIIQLQMLKSNEKENINLINLDENNTCLDKFINLFIDDLIILINNSSELKRSKGDNIYNNIIDYINDIKLEGKVINKEQLSTIFDSINQKDTNFFVDNINPKNILLNENMPFNCLLKKNCFLLIQNDDFEENIIHFDESKENIPSYFDIEHKNEIKCLKKDLLLKDCSVYLDDIYLYDENFIKIKNSYYYNYESNIEEHIIHDYRNKYTFLNYPTKLKNFSSNKYALPKIFLSCYNKLYQNKHFSLMYPKIDKKLLKNIYPNFPSHYLYYSELLKNNPQSTIFKDKLNCELMVVKHIIFGEIIFFNNFFVFKSLNNNDILKEYETNIDYIFSSGTKEIQLLDKLIIITYEEIEEIFNRCFAFIPQAIEIFLKNGKSYIFNFIQINNLKIFYNIISKISRNYQFKIIKDPKKEFENLNFTKQWEKNQINNEQYLLYLNKYSGRSYNDYNQYPVFPWITLSKSFFPEKEKIKEYDILYRNMFYFMGTQTEKERDDALVNYINTERDNPKNPVHFRFHYSTGGYTLLYLMRIFPFMDEHIRLQSDNFDSPSRMIHNIEDILNVIKESKDMRELIPEFFTSIEYFLNLNYVYFGQRPNDKIIVNNLLVPHINLCKEKLVNYIYFNKVFLNNRNDLTLNQNINLEKCEIYHWINLVFGYKQYPKDINKFNAFEKYSNRQSYSLLKFFRKYKEKKLIANTIIKKISNKKLRILYFGQTPEQLLKSKLSKYESDWKDIFLNKGNKIFDININDKIITFWISEDKDYFFFLIKNEENKNIYIFIYDYNMNKKFEVNIGKIKLFNLLNIEKKQNLLEEGNNLINNNNKNNNKNFLMPQKTYNSFLLYGKTKSNPINYKDISELYSLNPRDAILEFFDEYNIYFFVGRNKDNTIKIIDKKNTIKGIIKLKSFVSVLHKKDKESFFSGDMNGLLIEWKIKYKNITDYNSKLTLNNIELKREFKAHNNLITAINYNEKHNIILSSDIKGILYIRKYYDFELLTKIKIKEENCFVTQILLNDFNFIYTIIYNKNELKKFICLYTLNGILIEKSNLHTIIDIHPLKNGKIIFNRLEEFNLSIFGLNNIKEDNEAIISDIILKKIGVESSGFIKNFIIKDNNIYLLLKNGQFIKGFYEDLNLVCYGIN